MSLVARCYSSVVCLWFGAGCGNGVSTLGVCMCERPVKVCECGALSWQWLARGVCLSSQCV